MLSNVNFYLNKIKLQFLSEACLYKGNVYQQGQTWQDGCDYECECTDATKGMYRCTERCESQLD